MAITSQSGLLADLIPASEVGKVEDNTHPALSPVQTGAPQDPTIGTPEAIAKMYGPHAETAPEETETIVVEMADNDQDGVIGGDDPGAGSDGDVDDDGEPEVETERTVKRGRRKAAAAQTEGA